MSQVNGQLTTCERCGAQIFRKVIGEGEADGGFTRWNEFEEYPKGWGYVNIPGGPNKDTPVMVCPRCRALWEQTLRSYFIAGTDLDRPKEATT